MQRVATRNISRGLAPIGDSQLPAGTLVASAARSGQLAEDGTGEVSSFVEAMTRRMREPNVEINIMCRRVRITIRRRAVPEKAAVRLRHPAARFIVPLAGHLTYRKLGSDRQRVGVSTCRARRFNCDRCSHNFFGFTQNTEPDSPVRPEKVGSRFLPLLR
jgi:hypothetical protein